MPIFECSRCKCIDNTALTDFYRRRRLGKEPLCAGCDPNIGVPNRTIPGVAAKGMLLGSDGFLYPKNEDLEEIKKYQGVTIIKEL